MVLNNKFLTLLKLLWTLSIFFLGDKIGISLLCPSAACTQQSVDLTCNAQGCTTNQVTVSETLCSSYVTLSILPCDLDGSTEWIDVYIDGIHRGKCRSGTHNNPAENWYSCGTYSVMSREGFTVYLRATSKVSIRCTNSGEGLNSFYVYGRVHFHACVNKYDWCGVAETNGMCYDEDHETRILVGNECPISCGTCFTTLSPTGVPSFPPTLRPTSPTMSPSRKPSRPPTPNPTVMPTESPTCTDTIQFCGAIKSFCNSSNLETKVQMATDCASTCGSCTLEPTQIPTAVPSHPCEDSYAYCFALAQSGACYEDNWDGRLHFQNKCPVSCGTCNNRTVNPTSLPSPIPTINPTTPTSAPSLSPSRNPSPYPTQIPTISPTCVDTITYCNIIEGYCRSSDPGTLSKMLTDCAATCGFCTLQPSRNPTASPSLIPTRSPSTTPKMSPSPSPTKPPTTTRPSHKPSGLPSFSPTHRPSLLPTVFSSSLPTMSPFDPTITPSQLPSALPSVFPTAGPTMSPTNRPSKLPSGRPSATPSSQPSTPPSLFRTEIPSIKPSNNPTQCKDVFEFCFDLARFGACYENNYDMRNGIHEDCPVSCGTCYNNTISPTASPSISPSADPSKQPSPLPTAAPTAEPTCSDLKVYCRMITQFCSTSLIVQEQCAASCGFCILQPSLNLTASPTFIPTGTRSNDTSQPPKDEEPGVRRRKEDSILLTISPTSVTDDAQFQYQQFYDVWITIFICCTFASVLALIWKYRVFYLQGERKNQGEFVNLGDGKMIYNITERVCLRPMVIDAKSDESKEYLL